MRTPLSYPDLCHRAVRILEPCSTAVHPYCSGAARHLNAVLRKRSRFLVAPHAEYGVQSTTTARCWDCLCSSMRPSALGSSLRTIALPGAATPRCTMRPPLAQTCRVAGMTLEVRTQGVVEGFKLVTSFTVAAQGTRTGKHCFYRCCSRCYNLTVTERAQMYFANHL